MNPKLDGKVALVTGVSSPVGGEVARALRAAGATVVTQDVRVLELLGATGGGQVDGDDVRLKILSAQRAGDVVERIVREFGRLDIVVHNGCTQLDTRNGFKIHEEDLDRVYGECVKTAFYIAHAAASEYRRAKRGVILNITPTAQTDSQCVPWQSACAGALGQLSQALAQQLKDDGIRVNAICPTVSSYDEARRTMRGAALQSALLPQGFGREDCMSAAVRTAVFLASEASHYISGLVFPIEVNPGFC